MPKAIMKIQFNFKKQIRIDMKNLVDLSDESFQCLHLIGFDCEETAK